MFKQLEYIFLFAGTFAICAHAQNTFPATGNVGVGTTSPNASLEVNGSTQIDNGGSLGAGSASSCALGGASCISLNAIGSSSSAGYAQIQTYYAGVGYTTSMALIRWVATWESAQLHHGRCWLLGTALAQPLVWGASLAHRITSTSARCLGTIFR